VPSSRAAATPDVAARLGQGGADAQVQPQLKLNRGDPIHYEFTLVKRDRPDVSQNVLMWPAHVLSRLVAVITVRYHPLLGSSPGIVA